MLADFVLAVPKTEQDVNVQNAQRGQVAILKDIIGLEQELLEWKEETRK